MIRCAVLLSLIAGPLAAQTVVTEQRPGRWLSVPEAPGEVMAPVVSGALIEPVAPGPVLGGAATDPVIEMVAPDAGPVLNEGPDPLVTAEPELAPDARPETVPVPRPDALAAVVGGETSAVPQPTSASASVVVVGEDVAPEVPAAAGTGAEVMDVAAVAVEPSPPANEGPPDLQLRPAPRQQPAEVAAQTEALARQLAEEAQDIMASAPQALLPVVEGQPAPAPVFGADATQSGLSVPEAGPEPDAAHRSPAVPLVAVSVAMMGATEPLVPISAVLLPTAPNRWRPVVQPAVVQVPRPDPTPFLSRTRPAVPEAMRAVAAPVSPGAARLSAVVLPQMSWDAPEAPRLARATVPSPDRFPAFALPPGSLPDGPDALTRPIQPPVRRAEAMAAVLIAPPRRALRARTVMPSRAAMPVRDPALVSPEAPIRLPDPHPQAVARMIDDAMICWRLADLTSEARWAEITLDVALDENNMPAEASIRLTGFRGVLSSAAADAFQAARGALSGCAEATEGQPMTEAATLVFDRNGVRLR